MHVYKNVFDHFQKWAYHFTFQPAIYTCSSCSPFLPAFITLSSHRRTIGQWDHTTLCLKTAGFLRSGNKEKKRLLNWDCKIRQSLNFLVQDLITQWNIQVRELTREEHFLCLSDFLRLKVLTSAQRFKKLGKFLSLQAKIVPGAAHCSTCLDPNLSYCIKSKCSFRYICACETGLSWNGGFEQKYQCLVSWVTCASGSEGLSCFLHPHHN